jgi:succinate dehydrogenase/fumarate reductase flavoprotein subunit
LSSSELELPVTTAYEAARGGATVAVVDVASVFGGHAVVSEGGLALAGTPLQQRLGVTDAADLAYQDIIRLGAWAADNLPYAATIVPCPRMPAGSSRRLTARIASRCSGAYCSASR